MAATDVVVAKALGIDDATFTACASIESCLPVITKLKEYVTIAEAQKDSQEKINAKLETQQMNHEKRFSELEKKVMNADQRLKKKIEEYGELQRKYAASEKSLAEKTNALTSTSTSSSETTARLKQCELLLKQAQEDVLNRDETLNKKQIELDRERDSAKELFDDKEDAEKRARICAQEAEQARLEVSTLTMREHRLRQEVQMVSEQKGFVDQELASHMEEARTDRKQILSELADLQRNYDEKCSQADSVEISLETAVKENKVLNARISELLQKAEEDQSELLAIRKHSRLEIDNKTKLCELYKNMSEGNAAQIEELMGVIEELHTEHASTTGAQTKQLSTTTANLSEAQEELEAAIKRVNELEEQLRDVNIQLGRNSMNTTSTMNTSQMDADTMFPSASLASKKMKGGITLTEIYAQLTQAQDAREIAELKATKVEEDLNMILHEIEFKTPALIKQKENLEIAENKIVELTNRMQEGNLECRQLDEKIRENNRRLAFLEREKNVLEKQNTDMSHQVQRLMIVNEQLRTDRSVPDDDDDDVVGLDDIVSSNLVTVKSVAEMQQQNTQLRAVVRELTEQHENEERKQNAVQNIALKTKLEASISQIEQLRSTRVQQEEMVKTIVRQRDMFKALYHESYSKAEGTINVITGTTSPVSTPKTTPPAAATTTTVSFPSTSKNTSPHKSQKAQQDIDANSKLLHDLQASFEAYRTERSKNDVMIAEENNRIRLELDLKQEEKAQVELSLERVREQCDQLQAVGRAHIQERDQLQKRVHEYQSSNNGLERRLKELDQDLHDVKAESRLLRVELSNAKAEASLSAESEKRLTIEVESLSKDRNNQLMLFTNVQSVISSMKRESEQSRDRLVGQMEEYKSECVTLRKRLDETQELLKSNVVQIENQRESLREDLSKEQQKHHKTREELVEATCKVTSLDQNLEAVTAQLDEYKKKLNTMLAGNSSPEDDKRQLESAIIEIASLKKKVSDSAARVDQFKAIASSAEEQMSDVQKVQDELQVIINDSRERHTVELAAAKKAATEASSVLDNTKTALQASEKALAELQSKSANDQVEHEKLLSQLRTDVQTTQQHLKQAHASGKQFSIEAVESMDKYQKEIILHAADLQALKTTKAQRDALVNEIETLTSERDAANDELKLNMTSWETQKKMHEEKLEKEIETVAELRKQNENFHTIVNELRTLVTAKHDSEMSSATRANNDGDDNDDVERSDKAAGSALDTKTAKDLLEVVRYERQRAEIAQTHYEEIKLQVMSYEQRCKHLERQAADSQKSLQRERERNQDRAQTAGEYDELMKKVETLNLLHDSNRMLRDDNKRAELKAGELQAKVKQLETEITPLKEELRKIKKDSSDLTATLISTKNDLNRWKSRAIQLRDQYQNIDPDQFRQLQEDKKAFDDFKVAYEKRVQEFNAKIAAQNTKIVELSSGAKAEALSKQLVAMTSKHTSVTNDLNQLKATNNKIKRLARDYKAKKEALDATNETLTKDLETAKKEALDSTTVLTAKVKELETALAASQATSEKIIDQTTSVTKLEETHASEIKRITEENDIATKKATENYTKMKTQATKYRNGYVKISERIKTLKQENATLQAEVASIKGTSGGTPGAGVVETPTTSTPTTSTPTTSTPTTSTTTPPTPTPTSTPLQTPSQTVTPTKTIATPTTPALTVTATPFVPTTTTTTPTATATTTPTTTTTKEQAMRDRLLAKQNQTAASSQQVKIPAVVSNKRQRPDTETTPAGVAKSTEAPVAKKAHVSVVEVPVKVETVVPPVSTPTPTPTPTPTSATPTPVPTTSATPTASSTTTTTTTTTPTIPMTVTPVVVPPTVVDTPMVEVGDDDVDVDGDDVDDVDLNDNDVVPDVSKPTTPTPTATTTTTTPTTTSTTTAPTPTAVVVSAPSTSTTATPLTAATTTIPPSHEGTAAVVTGDVSTNDSVVPDTEVVESESAAVVVKPPPQTMTNTATSTSTATPTTTTTAPTTTTTTTAPTTTPTPSTATPVTATTTAPTTVVPAAQTTPTTEPPPPTTTTPLVTLSLRVTAPTTTTLPTTTTPTTTTAPSLLSSTTTPTSTAMTASRSISRSSRPPTLLVVPTPPLPVDESSQVPHTPILTEVNTDMAVPSRTTSSLSMAPSQFPFSESNVVHPTIPENDDVPTGEVIEEGAPTMSDNGNNNNNNNSNTSNDNNNTNDDIANNETDPDVVPEAAVPNDDTDEFGDIANDDDVGGGGVGDNGAEVPEETDLGGDEIEDTNHGTDADGAAEDDGFVPEEEAETQLVEVEEDTQLVDVEEGDEQEEEGAEEEDDDVTLEDDAEDDGKTADVADDAVKQKPVFKPVKITGPPADEPATTTAAAVAPPTTTTPTTTTTPITVTPTTTATTVQVSTPTPTPTTAATTSTPQTGGANDKKRKQTSGNVTSPNTEATEAKRRKHQLNKDNQQQGGRGRSRGRGRGRGNQRGRGGGRFAGKKKPS